MISLLISSVAFLVLVLSFSKDVARWIDYPKHPEYVRWFAWILALDALSAIPFASLRAQNRPARFAWVKMTNIAINILLNLFFLVFCPFILNHYSEGFMGRIITHVYHPNWGIEYI